MSTRIFNDEMTEFNYDYKVNWKFKTDISQMTAGNEQRRARWTFPRRKYSLVFKNKQTDDMKALIQFHYDHQGSYESFYFYDRDSRMTWTIPAAYKVTGGGTVSKVYLPFKKIKPLTGGNFTSDINVEIDSTPRTTNMTYDSDEGSITFTSSEPADSAVITVNYEYYTIVRFLADDIDYISTPGNLAASSLELMESR